MVNEELIYQTWKECNQNLSATVRALKEKGFTAVTRQTLSKWVKDNNWEERAAREDATLQMVQASADEDTVIAELTEQKDRYVTYLRSLPAGKVDNQATYALVGLITGIQNYQIKKVKHAAMAEVDKVAKAAGLSDEAVEEIQNKILGIK